MENSNQWTVKCSYCLQSLTPNEATVLDIEEDDQGRDLVTFRCKRCNKISKSNIYQG